MTKDRGQGGVFFGFLGGGGGLELSTQPLAPSESFEKGWLGRCLCHHQSKRLHLFLHDPRQMRMQFFLQGEGFGEIIPCYGIVFLNTRFFDSQIMGMTQG